jgi:ABC-type protease/lipase transport system fused ATPase/permease subunit
MSERPWQDDVGRQVRTLRTIVVALLLGPSVFLAVVLLARLGEARAQGGPSVLTWVALAAAGLCVLLRLIVPGAVVSAARRRLLRGQYDPAARAAGARRRQLHAFFQRTGDAGRLMIVYMTATLLAAAILEWAAFFLVVVYMIDPQVLSLAVAVALILAMAAQFPWRARVFSWIEGQLRRLEEERQFG